MKRTQGQSILGEFENVSLGDKRLDQRLLAIAQAMEKAPELSFVEQARDAGTLEATYRFLSNKRVTPEAIFEGHTTMTAQRAAAHDYVLVVHDTTEFRFGGTKERKGLGRVNTAKRDGFLAHYSLCLSPQGEPLGSVDLYAWSRLDAKKRSKAQGTLRDPHRESLRWEESARRASERLYGMTTPIHVMDREGDHFELFATLVDNCQRFVIRLGHDRRLNTGRGRDGHPMLNEALGSGPALFTREIQMGRRQREQATKKQKIYPERAPRKARLEIRAQSIQLYRGHQYPEHLPDSLSLNFVEAKEVGSPPDATPVVWRIVTTESIDTKAQINEVIDIYRKRWLIEEFFKAIKTGCRFESHQLEDIQGLLIALTLESIIAWQLLRLRHVARADPEAPGKPLLSDVQWATMMHLRASRGEVNRALSVNDVIDEIAKLGAHLRNNGPPGWAVLKRGLKKLNLLAEGFSLASNGYAQKDVINL